MEVLVWICSIVVVFWFYGKLFGIIDLIKWLEIFKSDDSKPNFPSCFSQYAQKRPRKYDK